ncbi:FRG domain-containing protein [Desulfospira joergensenii]|uniref:FRG domain-containing protein n=1 Tax=Desulfospira joergensenii TaxID=53329 RepID=UPI0003B41452|nr:FRG domain-containing protein [Desulfospira joergensenii]
MTDIIISSWSQLQEELFRGSWNETLCRYRSPYVFRGLSDSHYRLETSLMRLGGPYWQLERHILRNFRKYMQAEPGEIESFWHLLAVAQHHGLPTRLMDWTYSPYVALHFTTANIEKFNIDGVIWVVDYEKAHDRLPHTLGELLREEGAQAFTLELLARLRSRECEPPSREKAFRNFVETLTQFDELAENEEFLLFLEPPSINDRIVNQFALFSVMPNSQRVMDDWLSKNQDLFRRLVIPADLKWECRDKLDQCNITERVLFPGLDGLGSWLKRQYSPKS